ncbi:ABC transporter substrate-binding protein [Adhaeribacter radiodurans]|uniref:ABC transporter substrate-binding protein n=1 Tax=Adhaeribacter radiodurans TaxID=2745197 RepID=A0A7L7L858_9BACT|nr:ABC transporter substrate-binding protein [Adhaeribacter radiodurans]QMU28996.1 ABC transporter substrate-binding protein [Adhaeribacter radiodurans]
MNKSIQFILLIYWLLFGLPTPSGWAQTTKDFATKYENAKQLLASNKYQLAMTELQPLIAANQSAYSPGAMYLYAVAAAKAKKYTEASQKLNLLKNAYPSWPNLSEAAFLEANLAFEAKEYERALSILEGIKEKSLVKDVEAMEYNYLNQISDKAAMQNLLERFKDDKVLAQVYANKLVAGWYTAADKEILENLVKKFKLDKNKYAPNNLSAIKKNNFNVAVLLPFPQNDAEAKARRNQFVTDLYAGMLLAQDSLAKQQIQLNLFTYDAPADTNKIKTTLQLPELASMDLIVGPVYKSANKIISRYTQQHTVNSINPLSDEISLVKNSPNLFLFESSITTRAKQSAAYAYQNFPDKTAIILAETNKEDTAFANVYKREFERLGGKITQYTKFNPKNTSVATLLSAIDLTAIGHLLLLSNTPSVAINTMSRLALIDSSTPIITYPSWLNINQISLNQFDNRNIYFIYPKFIDNTLPGPQQFRRKYASRYNVPPSVYAYSGFEMLYYFGQILQKYGPQFNGGLQNEGPVSGVVFQGIGYAGAQDNQYVPLLKMENLQLTVANPIFR